MKSSITIPANAEATSEYRQAQSSVKVADEKVTEMTFGTNNLKSEVFKRGVKLDPSKCFNVHPFDQWDPSTLHPLGEFVPATMKAKVDGAFSIRGIAATIALTDTVGGVREIIEYDENESIIKPIMEPDRE